MIYTDTTYDGDRRKASVSNPYRNKTESTYGVTSYVYDGLSRTCVVIPPDGTAVAGSVCPASQPSNDVFTTYLGNTTTVTDQQGKSRESQTDGLGRFTTVWESPSGVNFQTTYSHDALDDLVSVVQGSSHNRSFIYDSLKRLTSAENADPTLIRREEWISLLKDGTRVCEQCFVKETPGVTLRKFEWPN
jgi:YD repeat-containing protein